MPGSLIFINMGKIDNKLTERMQAFIAQEEFTEQEAIDGATMLLQLNRNRALYSTVIRNPLKFVRKIKYELEKFLPSRLDGLTLNEVVKMDNEITPIIKEHVAVEKAVKEEQGEETVVLPLRNGIRPDHDELPDSIKALWTQNAERWKKIKQLYNLLAEIKHPCERYEYLKQMVELWYKYREDMNKYDSFKVGDDVANEPAAAETVTDAKAILSARTYISKNIDRLIELKDSEDLDEYARLRSKMQDRVNLLIGTHQDFKKENLAKLRLAGIDNLPHE